MVDLTRFRGKPIDPRYEAQQAHLAYQTLVYDAVDHGAPTPPPSTDTDLAWLCERFPIRARMVCRAADLPLYGISRNFDRPPEPLPLDILERLIVSMNDPDVAAAIKERLEVAGV